MRTAAKRDANEKEIIDALEQVGAKVKRLNDPDVPDLIVGFRGDLYLLEVKDGSRPPSQRKLRTGQQRFFDEWIGFKIVKVESIDQALRAINAVTSAY